LEMVSLKLFAPADLKPVSPNLIPPSN
jgi:hypothetical protein